MAKIIWVEDQSHWVKKFSPVLERTDFDGSPTQLEVFRFAEAASQYIRQASGKDKPDLVILDANMNGNSKAGFSVSRLLRKKWPALPVIYLSEHSGTEIEQGAFEHSLATDFIAKHQRNIADVLCWRIKSVLKRSDDDPARKETTLQAGNLTIDLTSWEVYWHGRKLMNPANPKRPLAPTPRKILRYLVESAPLPQTTGQIAEKIGQQGDKFSYDSYRQHIRTLRRSFDLVEGHEGEFSQQCQQGSYLVPFGDDGAYCWKEPGSTP